MPKHHSISWINRGIKTKPWRDKEVTYGIILIGSLPATFSQEVGYKLYGHLWRWTNNGVLMSPYSYNRRRRDIAEPIDTAVVEWEAC